MPNVRAVDEMNETELQAELVATLADRFIRYAQSVQFTITFNPIGIKKRAEHATKDLEEARA
jgi:hypothetical protein